MSDSQSQTAGLNLQLLVFTDCSEIKPLLLPLEHLHVDAVLYRDVADPQGIALLTIVNDPELFITDVRETLNSRVFRVLMQRHELTMTGRSWGDSAPSPREIFGDPDRPWAAWYTMRVTESFARLDEDAQRSALQGLVDGSDIDGEFTHVLLKSDALNRNGAQLVHGIHGSDPNALSAFVEAMHRAEGRSEHIAEAGPFFVGRVVQRGDTLSGPKARW